MANESGWQSRYQRLPELERAFEWIEEECSADDLLNAVYVIYTESGHKIGFTVGGRSGIECFMKRENNE